MIKNIFLPERINNNFLFGHNRLGLEITKSSLTATLVHVSSTTATIKEFYTESINKNNEEATEQNIIIALKNLFKKTGKSCQLHLALPSNIAIFKELTLPFLEREQIQQVLPFELESQIPFAIKDVLFDFLITKQDLQQKKSRILVGIAPQKDVDYYTRLIESAGYPLHTVTLDLFALYGLYTVHPIYSTMTEAALIDIGFSCTSISYIANNQLTGIRTINYGINTIAKNIAEKIDDSPAQVMEFISRFGFIQTDKPTLNEAIDKELTTFSKQILFTFDAFATQLSNYKKPQKIIVVSRGTIIKMFDKQLEQLLGISSEFFDTQALLTLKNLKTSGSINTIPLNHLISMASAYPFTASSFFNLLAHKKTAQAVQLLQHQAITTFVMLLIIISLAAGYSYMQYATARNQVNRAKQSALTLLSQEFDIIDRNLNAAVESAQQKLDEAEIIWAAISGQDRLSCLKYLQELCVKIDRDGIGLDIKTLNIAKQKITMTGQVRDFNALKTLEEELNSSKMFTLTSAPQERKFEITLAIKKTEEGQA